MKAITGDTIVIYVFLVQRPIDKEPWPTVFFDKERAKKYPSRCSKVHKVSIKMS